MQISYVVIYPVLTCVLDAHDALSSWASARTCGQWPADFALLSISWIVFFLESGSFLDTSTGWRQRMSPACTQTVRGKPTGSNKATMQQATRRKATHGRRSAWPGSPPGRRWRANPQRCTRSRQRRWSGGQRPGWGPRRC